MISVIEYQEERKLNSKNRYLSTTIAVYVSFLLCGIDMSISAQYKAQLAHAWGLGNNIAAVLTVSSAVGIGGIVASFFTGIISDKFGRRLSAIIGSFGWAIFAFGTLYAPNMTIAYLAGIIAGIANSFTNAALTPAMMDAYPDKRSLVTLLTKFFVSFGQFILPFIIVALVAGNIPFSFAFNGLGIIYVIIGIACFFVPFPSIQAKKDSSSKTNNQKSTEKSNNHIKITAESIALGLMGFSTTAVFMLWTQTNQELGKLYGLANPALLQSVYAIASLISVLVTSYIVSKGIKESTILLLYPLASAISLAIAFFVKNGTVLFIVAGLIGWFAAGGLMQLAVSLMSGLYPTMKATANSVISITNGISNWAVIQVAAIITASFGNFAPRAILLFNICICIIGALLALIVRAEESKRSKTGQKNLE